MPWTYTIANTSVLNKTSTINREFRSGASFAARSKDRGHAPHLSISDDSHHVTETIGFLYGDEDDKDKRASLARSSQYSESSVDGEDVTSPQRSVFSRRQGNENRSQTSIEQVNGQQIPHPSRSYSYERPNGLSHSPVMGSREQSPQETAQAHFPLNDIDYESSPAAVAQELSNLQALRRMSMDVHAAGDPDLPSLNPAAIPNAPSPTASDDDSSRLFWVPARLHPELAPKEFKTFLESKAEQIKRRSGDLSSLGSSPMSSRANSLSSNNSGLARKKSMLSREVNSSAGFQDGADIIEQRNSLSNGQDPNLAELEYLVANNMAPRPHSSDDDVDFILPSVPSSSLKRSTKTTLQRNRGVKGRGVGRPQRPLKRPQTADSDVTNSSAPSIPDMPASFMSSDADSLADTLSFSSSKSFAGAQNFSRPVGRSPSPPKENNPISIASNTFDSFLGSQNVSDRPSSEVEVPRPRRKHIIPSNQQPVPQIVETPPSDDRRTQNPSIDQTSDALQGSSSQQRHPERTSSREASVKIVAPGRPSMTRTSSSANVVPTKSSRAEIPPIIQPKQSLDQPSPLPGNDTNTSNLSFIPTLTVDKQSQEQQKSKKSSWGWLLGKDDDKGGKGKSNKNAQSHDNTRLDVLQTSIDGNSRRRETIELDRDSLRLEEERRKESQRKAGSSEKKEGHSFISTLFGGKKSKAEKEAKKSPRLSPEPPQRELKADIDYSWTRFSILEERAIYRMAHIKLANPRRPLYSQVLLSNFMYSYLAKVQQMHPQMNLPTSAKQQKKQKEQPAAQPEEFSTYQRYQQVSQQ